MFGFLVLVMVLSGVNATVFRLRPTGSWRRRMPTIFIDVARFAIIAVGLAMIFAYVWGANVGGLFTALGISSIVLGLTLQNSVGQIISGLLLLFEQPFQIGDWVETYLGARPVGRGELARHPHQHRQRAGDHPELGAGRSGLREPEPSARRPHHHGERRSSPAPTRPTRSARCSPMSPPICRSCTPTAGPSPPPRRSTEYTVTIPVRSPADDVAARSTFQRWLWYASRRAGLHLDGIEDDFSTPARRVEALRKIAPVLRASSTDMEALLPHVAVLRYGADEVMQNSGDVPASMSFVVKGRVRLVVDRQRRRGHPGRAPCTRVISSARPP